MNILEIMKNVETVSLNVSELAVIHAACFPLAWSETSLAEVLAITGTTTFMMPDRTGFSILRVTGNEAEIMTMAVLPTHRRRGSGSILVADMLKCAQENAARSVFLEVRKNNKPARALYEKHGFVEISQRKGYYHNPDGTYEDAIVMKKSL